MMSVTSASLWIYRRLVFNQTQFILSNFVLCGGPCHLTIIKHVIFLLRTAVAFTDGKGPYFRFWSQVVL